MSNIEYYLVITMSLVLGVTVVQVFEILATTQTLVYRSLQ